MKKIFREQLGRAFDSAFAESVPQLVRLESGIDMAIGQLYRMPLQEAFVYVLVQFSKFDNRFTLEIACCRANRYPTGNVLLPSISSDHLNWQVVLNEGVRFRIGLFMSSKGDYWWDCLEGAEPVTWDMAWAENVQRRPLHENVREAVMMVNEQVLPRLRQLA